MAEHETFRGDGGGSLSGSLRHQRLVSFQRSDGSSIEGDPAALMRLRTLLDQTISHPDDSSLDRQRSAVKIDVAPTQRQELTSPGSRRSSQHDEGGQVGVGLLGGRRSSSEARWTTRAVERIS